MSERRKKATELAQQEWDEMTPTQKEYARKLFRLGSDECEEHKEGAEPEAIKDLCKLGMMTGFGYGEGDSATTEWSLSSWGNFVVGGSRG